MKCIPCFLILIFVACQTKDESSIAMQKMDVEMLTNNITILATDSMEGRARCTVGET